MDIQPPAALIPPQGGGLPPELQGQLTPEMLNMPGTPDPLLFGQLTGNPVPPSEELDILSGLPPGAI